MAEILNGVVDRIVDGKRAVILIESLGRELVVDVQQLDITVDEGDWLDLELASNDEIIILSVNQALTQEKTANVESVMDRLKRRKGSKFR